MLRQPSRRDIQRPDRAPKLPQGPTGGCQLHKAGRMSRKQAMIDWWAMKFSRAGGSAPAVRAQSPSSWYPLTTGMSRTRPAMAEQHQKLHPTALILIVGAHHKPSKALIYHPEGMHACDCATVILDSRDGGVLCTCRRR